MFKEEELKDRKIRKKGLRGKKTMKEEEGRKNKDYKEIKEGEGWERKDSEERILRIEENEGKEKKLSWKRFMKEG